MRPCCGWLSCRAMYSCMRPRQTCSAARLGTSLVLISASRSSSVSVIQDLVIIVRLIQNLCSVVLDPYRTSFLILVSRVLRYSWGLGYLWTELYFSGICSWARPKLSSTPSPPPQLSRLLHPAGFVTPLNGFVSTSTGPVLPISGFFPAFNESNLSPKSLSDRHHLGSFP